jgi:hypothetical protein
MYSCGNREPFSKPVQDCRSHNQGLPVVCNVFPVGRKRGEPLEFEMFSDWHFERDANGQMGILESKTGIASSF